MIRLLSVNAGTSLQDAGRPGWKRFGVPVSGAMDAESAWWANLLVGNPPEAPVLEILLGQGRWEAVTPCTLAITGAAAESDHPLWRSFTTEPGEIISLRGARAGVWSYLAIAGGFEAPHFFGSASTNARAGLGTALTASQSLAAQADRLPQPSPGVAGRFLPASERPSFGPSLRVPCWEGPEWQSLSDQDRSTFLSTSWRISPRSDRAGYRLEGPSLGASLCGILSSPLTLGTIQLPPGGTPLVVMRDGPTVGGYPRIGMLDPAILSRFSQQAPGTEVTFDFVS